jgi:peptide/nickel transport system substrate-binding protein
MKNLSKVLLLGVVLALLAVLAIPVAAQEGEGGTIVGSTFGSSGADTLNPVFCLDVVCQRLVSLLYPGFVAVDPPSATVQPGAPGGLATGWTVSDDGLVYTFTLRNDWNWSDGTPITAKDVLYSWNALIDPANESDLSFIAASQGGTIESVEMVDDYTVTVTFNAADCTAVASVGSIVPIPSHILPENPGELISSDYNLNPTVAGGPFLFGSYTPEQVSLVFNPDYPASDTQLGYVSPGVFVQKLVTDQTVQVQQFLDGQISYLESVPSASVADVRAGVDAGTLQVYDYAGNSWDYLALNFADPTNPQSAFDESGNAIDQGNHPLFSDPRVRKAIAMALDIDAIIEGAAFGAGTRMVSSQIPTSWASNPDLEAIPYDVEGAKALLAEAGWTDEDGDGVLEAHGTMYAEDGTPFSFTLQTNEGNSRRAAIGQLVQDQLGQIGMQVDFSTVDFNVFYDEVVFGQGFDAVIGGWREGFPDDPDQEQLFAARSDIIGAGSNFTSYNNAEVDALLRDGLTVPGCAPEDRAPIYQQVEAIMQEDLPYIWLFVQDGIYAAQGDIENWTPLPAQPVWNLDAWTVTP